MRDRYERFAKLLGLDPKWLGKTFTDRRHNYQIIGLAENISKKAVVEVRSDSGVGYAYPVDAIVALMSKNPAAAIKALDDKRIAKIRAAAKSHLEWSATAYGYPAYGTKFQDRGKTYTVIGSTKGRVRPILAQAEGSDRLTCFPLAMVKAGLAKAA